MKIAIQTSSVLHRAGIEAGARLLREAGFDGVDLSLDTLASRDAGLQDPVTGFFDSPDEVLQAEIEPILRAFRENGLEILQAHAPLPAHTGDPEVNEYGRRMLKKIIMLCGYAGCPHLVTHPLMRVGDPAVTPPADVDHPANVEMYTALIPEARRYGVTVCLENLVFRHKNSPVYGSANDPHCGAEMVDRLNAAAGEELFGFCLDVGHASLLGQDVALAMRTLGKRIKTLHLHDNDGFMDRHMLPFTGTADWDRICAGAREIGYTGVLDFETSGAVDAFPLSVFPELLALTVKTGRYLARRIEG